MVLLISSLQVLSDVDVTAFIMEDEAANIFLSAVTVSRFHIPLKPNYNVKMEKVAQRMHLTQVEKHRFTLVYLSIVYLSLAQ